MVPLVFGWIFAAHQLGAAFAAYVAGVLRTEFGNYTLAFNGAAWMSVLAAVMVLRIGGSASPRASGRPLTPWPPPVTATDSRWCCPAWHHRAADSRRSRPEGIHDVAHRTTQQGVQHGCN